MHFEYITIICFLRVLSQDIGLYRYYIYIYIYIIGREREREREMYVCVCVKVLKFKGVNSCQFHNVHRSPCIVYLPLRPPGAPIAPRRPSEAEPPHGQSADHPKCQRRTDQQEYSTFGDFLLGNCLNWPHNNGMCWFLITKLSSDVSRGLDNLRGAKTSVSAHRTPEPVPSKAST